LNRFLVLFSILSLAGCAGEELRYMQSNTEGPDEFMIIPAEPLTAPDNFSDLPVPTPGGRNLTDPNPIERAIIALDGRVDAIESSGVPDRDRALVEFTHRNGVPGDIRQVVLEEDVDYRRRRSRFSRFRLFDFNRYNDVYAPQTLDPFIEHRRFRRAGVATPSAPPQVN